jgi:hypothetical protein
MDTSHRDNVPLFYSRLGTQHSDDSLNANLEHLEWRMCLMPASGSNADNKMLLLHSMYKPGSRNPHLPSIIAITLERVHTRPTARIPDLDSPVTRP